MRHLDLRLAIVGLAGLVGLALGAAGAARAATIQVTTRNDSVANDGRCSLREAVTAANLNAASGAAPGECVAGDPAPVVDVIRLRRGKYKISRGAAGDDLNLGGDLDVTESVVVQGKGRGSKVMNEIGDPSVAGDGDRLFHVDPRAVGGIDATFVRVALIGGDVGCTGPECASGASALEMAGPGALTLKRCQVLRSSATCFGEGCGTGEDGAAIRAAGGGPLTIRRSKIRGNAVRCSDTGCATGDAAVTMLRPGGASAAAFTLEESIVQRNSAACLGARCSAGSAMTIAARTITLGTADLNENAVACEGERCRSGNVHSLFAREGTTVQNVEISANTLECEGDDCATGAVVEAQGGLGDVAFRTIGAEDNELRCLGDGCLVGGVADLRAGFGDVELDDAVLARSASSCSGVDCVALVLFDADAAESMRIRDVIVTETDTRCSGASCAALGTVRAGGETVDVATTTAESSQVSCSGEACVVGSILDVNGEAATLETVSFRDDGVSCVGPGCGVRNLVNLSGVAGPVAARRTLVNRSFGFCSGRDCAVRSLLDVSSNAAVALDEARVDVSEVFCQGSPCSVEPLVALASSSVVTVAGSVLDANKTECLGDACSSNPIVDLEAPLATIGGSTFSANRARCDGVACSAGLGGALHNRAARLTVTDTAFTANATDGFGGAVFNAPQSELALVRVALERNAAGLRGTIEFGGAGGAIYNDADGAKKGLLSLRDSLVRENRALLGGGILNEGTLSSLTGTALDGNLPTNCTNLSGGAGCP